MHMVVCAGSPSPFAAYRGRVIFGLMVMLVGAFLLADRFDWWGVRVNLPLWPWVLLFIGLARSRANGHRPMSRVALWFVAIGAWGILTEYRLFGFGYGRGWPLLVLIAGLFVVWRAVDPSSQRCARGERS